MIRTTSCYCGLIAGSQDSLNVNLGKDIYMAGCGVQLACVIVFTGIVLVFYQNISYNVRVRNTRPQSR